MKISGQIDKESAADVVDKVKQELQNLGDEFYLINDISEFKPSSQDVKAAITKRKSLIEDAGVDAVDRVTGESVISKMLFESAGGEYEYQEGTAESIDVAREMLDDL